MPILDRRSFVRSAAAVGTVAAVGRVTTAPAAAATSSYPAVWAERLCQNSGTNTHQSWRTTVYGNDGAVLDIVRRSGVRFVRDKLVPPLRPQHDAFQMFRAAGIKVHSTVLSQDLSATRADVDAFMAKAVALGGPAMFSGFEGPNEPNANGGDWLKQTVTLMRHIRESRDAHGLSAIPLAGPSLHHTKAMRNGDYEKLAAADIRKYTDMGALHFYPAGRDLGHRLDSVLTKLRPVYPGQEIVLTETGWNTGVGVEGANATVPEDVQAVYAARALAQAFVRGVKVSLYEALDDAPGMGANAWQEHWGHFATCPSLDASTWREKPALTKVSTLLAACSDPGPTYSPAPFRGSISAPSDVRQLLLGKRNGTYQLLLWRDVDIYDPTKQKPIDVGTRTVSVTTGKKTQRVSVGGELVVVRL
jgi:hypothetical protein